jgi:Icc-related predicted phosphoesterase
MVSQEKIRLAAVGDTHCTKSSAGELRAFFSQAADAADILLLCGDLTDYGLPEEAHVLAEELSAARIPIVGVLGNHDFESGKEDEVCRILTDAGVRLLDGEACIINGVGIAGVKGFAGGYGRRALGPWGENTKRRYRANRRRSMLSLERAGLRSR